MADKVEVDSFFDHNEKLPKKIDQYEIKKSLGVGGMGEVFLAYDPHCERDIALKMIKTKLISHPIIKKRFMKEARYASKLSHPNIIPIYSIHEEQSQIYYTMPYVEGETLREILKNTKLRERKGEAPHEIGVSIPALSRIFLSICQAVSYSHTKGILHRDLKPENIIVGKFGEVFLLDWGIATDLKNTNDEEGIDDDLIESEPNLTVPGKVLGTVNYMAPERANKEKASTSTEIYALGVILYQILTLNFPFRRKDIEHFKRIMKFERILPPEEMAPYRDIPKQLSESCMKCLSPDPEHRYNSIEEMIVDLKNYIDGRPEWILSTELDIYNRHHWEFQENILLSKHMAITRIIDLMEWVALMISKNLYPGNIKIEFNLKLPKDNSGIGVLMCLPEKEERKGLQEGFCLWIGSSSNPYATLFRSNAELLSIPNTEIKADEFSKITIEKIDNSLKFFVDDHIKLNYFSHIPIVGTHLGFSYKDPNFEISSLKIYTGSQNVMVNCLSIPDMLLSSKNFTRAFAEYKKISQSFEGRTEGREAQFRAGLTLLEQAKYETSTSEKSNLLSRSFDEFEKLRATPGAPLEYLGKSLIYHVEDDNEEEIKCLELSVRKYAKHPLLPIIKEQIIYRLHESSNLDRKAAYSFALMALRLLPEIFISYENTKFINHLIKHWYPLQFVDFDFTFCDKKYEYLHTAIILSFWVKKPKILCEILDRIPEDLPETKYIFINGLFCLFHMGNKELAFEKHREFHHHLANISNREASYCLSLFEIVQATNPLQARFDRFFEICNKPLKRKELRAFTSLIRIAESHLAYEDLKALLEKASNLEMSENLQCEIKTLSTRIALSFKKLEDLEKLFKSFEENLLSDYRSPVSFYYGCYLSLSQGKKHAIKHFSKIKADYPLPLCLAINVILGNIELSKFESLDFFDFEISMTYDYLSLYFLSIGKDKKTQEMKKLSSDLLEDS